MRYSQQKITKSDQTIALFTSVNVFPFYKTNEKTFFFFFHIDIKTSFMSTNVELRILLRFDPHPTLT